MSVVLDASAVLAFLKSEPGSDVVRKHLAGACLSTVSLLEVLQVSQRFEQGVNKTFRLLAGWQVEFVPFDEEQTLAASAISKEACSADISLPDRACLALAKVRKLPVVTADRLWTTWKLDVRVIPIRKASRES